MSRLLCLSALVASSVFATPQNALKKFPPMKLPVQLSAKQTGSASLTPKDVDALGFLKLTGAPKELLQWTPTPEEGETQNLVATGAAKVGANTLLLLRHDLQFPMGNFSRTFALVFVGDKLVSATLVHVAEETEAGDTTSDATVAADGTISRLVKHVIPVHAEGLPETLEVSFSESRKLRVDGTWEPLVSNARTQSGKYVDAKSKEELWLFDAQVFYRGNETKPLQQLDFDGKGVRFKGSKATYSLVWDASKRAITCTDPKGKPQTFTREW